jgi:hypothetical protein
MAKYTPPQQSKFSQVFDVIVLMALIIGALRLPLMLGMAGGSKVSAPLENPTWETLKQNPVMVEKWNALGYTDPAAVNEMITARYDYWAFSTFELILMVVVVIGYFVLIVKFSDTEYREVISEKFGDK